MGLKKFTNFKIHVSEKIHDFGKKRSQIGKKIKKIEKEFMDYKKSSWTFKNCLRIWKTSQIWKMFNNLENIFEYEICSWIFKNVHKYEQRNCEKITWKKSVKRQKKGLKTGRKLDRK